jgi:hypothetical protein
MGKSVAMADAPSSIAGWARSAPVVAWLAAGVFTWLAVADSLADRSGSATWPVAVVGVVVWATVFVAVLVPSTASLTVARWFAPLSVAAAIGALAAGAAPALGVLAVMTSLVAVAVLATAEVGRAFAQASAYGEEDRFPLRLPAAFVLPLALLWLAWAALVVGGVMALAAAVWWLGALLAVVAAGATWLLLPRVHRLSKRWLVVVPAGVVVHDPVVLGETLMVTRANLRRVGLALDGTEAADLTGPTGGHAIEVAVGEMVTALLPPSSANPGGRAMHVQSFLVAPSRPGQALAAAAARRHPVG